VFQTRCPQKHLLKIIIESESNTSILNHQIDLPSLQTILSELPLLPKGNLKETCKVEDIVILMWDFKDFTPCREALLKHFGGISCLKRYFTIEDASLRGKGNIALPYFTLVGNKKN